MYIYVYTYIYRCLGKIPGNDSLGRGGTCVSLLPAAHAKQSDNATDAQLAAETRRNGRQGMFRLRVEG